MYFQFKRFNYIYMYWFNLNRHIFKQNTLDYRLAMIVLSKDLDNATYTSWR